MKLSVAQLLPKRAFARNVSVLAGGTAGAQLLTILASPLLTRLYTPEDFGLFAVYSGISALLVVVASLRYELAIPLPKDDEEAVNVVMLSILVVIGMTILYYLIVFLFSNNISDLLNVPELRKYFWLIPIGVLLAAVFNIVKYTAIRINNFSTIAKTRIVQEITKTAIQLLGFKGGVLSLLLGFIGSQGVGFISLLRIVSRQLKFKWSWQGIASAANRYQRFPIFSTWSAFFNTAGVQLPPLMFASLFNATAAGMYILAHRVLAMPMAVIGQSVASVFFSNAAEAYREGRLGVLVVKVHDKLAKFAMPPAFILVLTGPDLFAWVFGDQWRQAGEFARWMAPWIYMVFVVSPMSILYEVMERQRTGMLFQGILLSARIVAIIIGASYEDLILTVMLFSIFGALCWIGLLIWMAKISEASYAKICKSMFSATLMTSICVVPLALGVYYIDEINVKIILMCASLMLLVAYYANNVMGIYR